MREKSIASETFVWIYYYGSGCPSICPFKSEFASISVSKMQVRCQNKNAAIIWCTPSKHKIWKKKNVMIIVHWLVNLSPQTISGLGVFCVGKNLLEKKTSTENNYLGEYKITIFFDPIHDKNVVLNCMKIHFCKYF